MPLRLRSLAPIDDARGDLSLSKVAETTPFVRARFDLALIAPRQMEA
jgi:hypothetical protein